jgi:3-dehydroquinate synthase
LEATPITSAERYLELMRHDKKVSAGLMRLVLLQAIGQAVVSAEASETAILQAIQAGLAVSPSARNVPPTQN